MDRSLDRELRRYLAKTGRGWAGWGGAGMKGRGLEGAVMALGGFLEKATGAGASPTHQLSGETAQP